ncbi:MAG: PAS/PAC sensor hybrid histidine kinase [uncultured bacterium]|nr:MAG: PAS/PAC sensor hybrid histidine kinase [uncultured bacterium]
MAEKPSHEELLDTIALLEDEKRYRIIFENSPLAMVMFDRDGTILDCNERFVQMMGSRREKLIGFNTARRSTPKMQEAIKKAMAGEPAVYEDAFSPAPGGKTTYLRVMFNPVTPGQAPSAVIATLEDVTKRRLAEEVIKETEDKLRASESRLRFALAGANDGLLDANLQAGTVYFSERCHEILGYAPGDGKNIVTDWKSLVHPGDFPQTWERLVALFKRKISILRMELRLRMENGEWKWVLIRAKVVEWGEDGRALRLTGTLTDIDQRRKIEETQMFLIEGDRFAAGGDFFQALARYLADLLRMDYVCIDRLEGDRLSARTVAIYHDGRFKDNVTYTLQDTPCGSVVGKTICCYERDVRHLFPRDAVLQEMAAEGYAGTTLWDSRGKEIGLIAIVSRQPLANPDLAESILKLVAIRATGELERREAEREKSILQTQLLQAQKMESIGRLAGGVAHDFNNMLGVILGHVELAQEQIEPNGQLFLDLQEVKNAAERSAELTRQLLAFARKQTVSPKVLDLNETVEGMLKMLRRLIGEDIDLGWLPAQGLWPVKIDPAQIDQILANLMVNARDAIAGVGRVSIETANIAIDDDYCADHAGFIPGSYVILSVSDNGCGMDKEIREHIFEPFFTTKEIGQGTGLGLATIYGIVQQNGGFVNVYSEPGQGTMFRIYLPKHVGQASVPDPGNIAGNDRAGPGDHSAGGG